MLLQNLTITNKTHDTTEKFGIFIAAYKAQTFLSPWKN